MWNLLRTLAFPAACLFLALAIGGCGQLPAPESKSPKQAAASSKVVEKADPKGPRDESLTPEEYIRLGMPAHDREWSGSDMVKAAEVLESFRQRGYQHLPRYQSERSGVVFDRLTSNQNLALLRNRSLALEGRFPQMLIQLQASNQVLKLYLSACLEKKVGAGELVELTGSQLRLIVAGLELVDEFMPTLNKNDPSYPVRMQGLEKMKGGLANVVAGSLQTLTERKTFGGAELARLIGYMQETFPSIVPRLPPGAQTETTVRLETLQKDPAMKDLRPGLQELASKVKGSLAIASPSQ